MYSLSCVQKSLALVIGLAFVVMPTVCLGEEIPAYRWANVTPKAAFAPRDGAGALAYKDKMWLIGGWNPRDEKHFPLDCSNDVWQSTDGAAWTSVRPNTFGTDVFDPAHEWEGRHTAGYVVFKDKMWIIGGDPIQGHYQSDVWNSTDGKTWNHVNKGQDVPWAPRILHLTAVFQDKIWVMGGQTTSQFAPATNVLYDDVWNSEDGVHWTEVPQEGPHWSPRGMIGGSVVHEDRLWILGGGTYDTPDIARREMYDDVWSTADGIHWECHIEHAPWYPRQYHDVAVFDGRMWLLEGCNRYAGVVNRNDVWHSVDGVTWHELHDTPWPPRHAASVFVHDDALWMVAGNNMESDVWKLERTGQTIDAPTASAPQSRSITALLREPLPAENLTCSSKTTQILIQGPTFCYAVNSANGCIEQLDVTRKGTAVVRLLKPSGLWFDGVCLGDATSCTTEIVSQTKNKVVLATKGILPADLPYSLQSTFYNDGVVVSEVTLKPNKDFVLRQGIRHEVSATGQFTQYLHKRRDTNGMDCLKGALPQSGTTVGLKTLTSCLEVFSSEAALAVFTDRGASHRSSTDLETASLYVGQSVGEDTSVKLAQHIIRVGQGSPPHTLLAGEEFTFRIGLAVAPNRLPHARWRDLRMFQWIGDGKNPYPTDAEINAAAQLGFVLFQMHRLGVPGEPRPPAGELNRVLKTVHDAGMLFIWADSADLMYKCAKGVQELIDAGKWPLWQGFNYGGRYKAKMDSYCDLVATCLACPNGMADYRVKCWEQMLGKYPVDGMYIDDNLGYANCTLWKEHGHPEKVYDCLIELHDVNWRRRQTILSGNPCAVLIDHCTHAMVLPVISAFDGHLFGEGYGFPSAESYWNTFGALRNLPASGYLWAGDSEPKRCSAQAAYAFDLLTGGGQYSYPDWRLWPEKFPYASGVSPDEPLYVKTYNLAQYYFGMYESLPYFFANSKDLFSTNAPNTYATIYQNETWNEALVVVANLSKTTSKTSLVLHDPDGIPALAGDRRLSVYDVNLRTAVVARGQDALKELSDLSIGPLQIKLLYLREVSGDGVYHQWGGKRLAERWNPATGKLTVKLYGPVGLQDSVFIGTGGKGVKQVTVNGRPVEFFADSARSMIHGSVTFSKEPTTLEVTCTSDGATGLPNQAITPDRLTTEVLSKQQ